MNQQSYFAILSAGNLIADLCTKIHLQGYLSPLVREKN